MANTTKLRNVPNSIRSVNTCETCKYVFRFLEPDSESLHYCTFQALQRPQTWLEIAQSGGNFEAVNKAAEEFDKWCELHQVQTYELCDNYKEI